jgi:hypothetical protein
MLRSAINFDNLWHQTLPKLHDAGFQRKEAMMTNFMGEFGCRAIHNGL